MAARNAGHKPPKVDDGVPQDVEKQGGRKVQGKRYRPLPTGTHGLTPNWSSATSASVCRKR